MQLNLTEARVQVSLNYYYLIFYIIMTIFNFDKHASTLYDIL